MKKQLIAALFIGLNLITLNSQSSYAYNANDLQKLRNTGSCQNCDLSNADLSNINLTKANLYGANLTNANLTNAKIIDSDLRSVTFTGATINNTNVYGTQIAISSLSQNQYNGLVFKKPEKLVEKVGIVTPDPVQDSFVSLYNESGYVANYTLTYMIDQNIGGQMILMPKVETGSVSLGFSAKLAIPGKAKNIVFNVQAVGRGDYVISEQLSAGSPTCYKIYGTVFSPQQAKNTCSSF